MGSPEGSGADCERPRRKVDLLVGFWIMETELTQAQWRVVAKTDPSRFNGDDRPVEQISWSDCEKFIKALDELCPIEGDLQFDLPTEAEWEYARRAGSTDERYGELDEIAQYKENSEEGTRPVAQKKPNAWGLYDMIGNVAERTLDYWAADYYEYGANYTPMGPDFGELLSVRGGSWGDDADACRAAYRRGESRTTKSDRLGVRLAPVDRAGDWVPYKRLESAEVSFFDPSGAEPGERRVATINGVEFPFRYCPPGALAKNSGKASEGDEDDASASSSSETPEVDAGYWIAETLLTQAQWRALTGENESAYKGGECRSTRFLIAKSKG